MEKIFSKDAQTSEKNQLEFLGVKEAIKSKSHQKASLPDRSN